MFNNCRLYNGPDSEYTETADILEVLFAETMERILPESKKKEKPIHSESDSEVDEKPPPKKPAKKKAGPKSKTERSNKRKSQQS